jgi:hypothetical protein
MSAEEKGSAKKKAIWVLIISLIIAVCSAGFVRLRQAGEDSFVASTKATLGPKGHRDGG